MLNVSNDFLTAIKASSRRLAAKVFIQWDYPFFANGAAYTSNYAIQNESEISDGITEKVYNKIGLQSTAFTNVNLSIVPAFTLTIKYISAVSSTNINFIFDTVNKYPINMGIVLKKANVTVLTQTNINCGNYIYSFPMSPPTEFDEMAITINEWSASGYVKIFSVLPVFSSVFNSEDIISMRVNESIVNGNTISLCSVNSSSLDLILNNDSKLFSPGSSFYNAYMIPNRKIMPYIGVWTGSQFEFCPMGIYYSDKWSLDDKGVAMTVTGLDIISLLDDIPFKSAYDFAMYTPTLKEVIEEQISNTNFYLNYTISNLAFNNYYGFTDGIPEMLDTARNTIFYASEAICGYFHCKKDGNIIVDNLYNVTCPPEDIQFYTLENIYRQNSKNINSASVNSIIITPYYQPDSTIDTFEFALSSGNVANSGKILFEINNNPFIAFLVTAEDDTQLHILSLDIITPLNKNMFEMEWQGNPANEIYDIIGADNSDPAGVDGTDGYNTILIYSNEYVYNGGLTCKTRGRLYAN